MSTSIADKLLAEERGVPSPTTVAAPTTVASPAPTTVAAPTTEPSPAPTTVASPAPTTVAAGTTEPAPTTVVSPAPTTVAAGTTEPAPTTVAEMVNLTDQQLEESLRRAGFLKEGQTLESLKPAPTEDEVQKAAKKKKEDAFKYALENGAVEKETYDQYVIDSAKPVEETAFLTFKDSFLDDIKGTDDEGTYNDDDIRALYEKRGYTPKEKSKLADAYLQNKYGILHGDNIVKDYESHQTTLQKATEYKGIVDQAISKVETNVFKTVVDNVEVEYKPSKEAIEAVRKVYTDQKAFNVFSGEVTAETMAEAMKTNIIMNDFDRFVLEVSQSYHAKMVEKHQLGRRGVDGILRYGIEGNGGTGGTGGASNKVADGLLEANKK